MYHLRLIHWQADMAQERAARLRAQGFQVESAPLNPTELRAMRENPPDAILIDLSRSPSQGRDLGLNLRKYKVTRQVPLIFVGGEPEKIAQVRALLPDATFADWQTIEAAVQATLANPPVDPVVPDSVFAAYAGTPLPKKLGIKANSRVVLIDAPADFENMLGNLPEGATVQRGIQQGDVHLWFATSRDELEARLDQMRTLAASGSLWIIWPKKSAKRAGDLTQNIVRQSGLSCGLVDYKICSVDDTWSGLCFVQRKPKST